MFGLKTEIFTSRHRENEMSHRKRLEAIGTTTLRTEEDWSPQLLGWGDQDWSPQLLGWGDQQCIGRSFQKARMLGYTRPRSPLMSA